MRACVRACGRACGRAWLIIGTGRYNLRHCAADCGGCGFSKCNLGGGATTSHVLSPTLVSAWTDLADDADADADAPAAARFWFNYTFGTPVRGEPPQMASLAVIINSTTTTSSLASRHHVVQNQRKARGYQSRAVAATAASSSLSSSTQEVEVQFELQWWGKKPTREAESLWFTVSPIVCPTDTDANSNSDNATTCNSDSGWLMDKLGRYVSE